MAIDCHAAVRQLNHPSLGSLARTAGLPSGSGAISLPGLGFLAVTWPCWCLGFPVGAPWPSPRPYWCQGFPAPAAAGPARTPQPLFSQLVPIPGLYTSTTANIAGLIASCKISLGAWFYIVRSARARFIWWFASGLVKVVRKLIVQLNLTPVAAMMKLTCS